MGWSVASYPLSSQAPTPVEVELGCDNLECYPALGLFLGMVLNIEKKQKKNGRQPQKNGGRPKNKIKKMEGEPINQRRHNLTKHSINSPNCHSPTQPQLVLELRHGHIFQ